MKWTLLFLLASASASAQTYVKPYSLSRGLSEKFDQKVIGPMVASSPYSWNNAASIGINYRTRQDRIRIGLTYSRTFQTGTNTVSAEIHYNILQWGRRRARSHEAPVSMETPH
jgi:hypothetical protein